MGRRSSVTDGGGGIASFSYSKNDVLGAASSPGNSRQIEYDGLGRITSVCELTPSASPANPACGQKTGTGTGFLTTYTYDSPAPNAVTVKQQANGATSQTRTYYYDGLGRLTSETNPENGTTTYTYDTIPAGCWPFTDSQIGNLVAKTDADGSLICYHYDALHRLEDVGNNKQSTSNAVRRLRYDSTANGVVSAPAAAKFNNAAGRLIEAETDDGAGMITDEWFSYSPRGEITDVYESTPNSNGYYHTTASYFANGALNALTGVPNHTAGWTFSVDGEGRPSTVTDNITPTDLVTQTSYNTASQPINVVLGDSATYGSDSYRYDANTGRMTQYSFNVVGAGYANLLYESQAMQDTNYWQAIGFGVAAPTVTGNATDPNGGQTGDTIVFPAIPNPSTEYTLLQETVTPSVVAGQQFTFSVYLRANSTQSISVGWKTFTASAYSYSIETVSTSWQRFIVTGTVPTSDTSTQITAYIQGDSTTASQTINAWGAQLQIGNSTNYQPTSNGADPFSVTGNLTWNTNGTLQQLSIFDLFDTANNQTCQYGYDDLSRLTSANCGSAADQSFSYDAFGNISKTGSPNAFTPTYASNNQIQAISGCSPPFSQSTAYDSDGNLLYDCTNTYTYNSYGQVASINGVAFTYDALGRMVENGTNEMLYSPIGKLALMTKQIPISIFLPLPGGEQATYTGSTIRFRHYDWLGSSRFESNTSDKEYGDLAYAPFGESYSIKNTPYVSFTGQQSDIVSNLYDFPAREYSPGQGRWISPDPAGLAAANFSNPQSFNRYAYVMNNPLNLADPSGMDPWAGQGCAYSISDGTGVCSTAGLPDDPSTTQDPSVIQQIQNFVINASGTLVYQAPPPFDFSGFGGFAFDSWTNSATDVAMGSIGEAIFHGQGSQVWSNAAGTMNMLTGAYAGGFALGTGAVLAAPAIANGVAYGIGYTQAMLAGSGGVLLGKWVSASDNYILDAQEMGVDYFNLGNRGWGLINYFGDATTANQGFLDGVVGRGLPIYLGSQPVGAGGTYAWELEYLFDAGVPNRALFPAW